MEDGICYVDTIEHEGRLWIVPEWIDGWPAEGYSRPARAIRVDQLGCKPAPVGFECEWALQGSLPKAVFDGTTQSSEDTRFEILTLPEWYVEIPDDDEHADYPRQ